MSTSPEHETRSGRPNPTVFATLQARDAPALIGFYVRAFGFELTARYDDGDLVAHAQLNWPEGHGAVMLGSHSPDKEWSPEPEPPAGTS